MKKIIITLTLLLTIGMAASQAQTWTDSWALGFGLNYPRYSSVNITALNTNYGTYLSLQHNSSERVGLRIKAGYSHLEGSWSDAFAVENTEKTDLISGDLAVLYYLDPWAQVSPFLFGGVGGSYRMVDNGATGWIDKEYGSQVNAGAGIEYMMNHNWSFVAEGSYHITSNSNLDGTVVSSEVNGYDSYLVFSAGFNFFFRKEKPSRRYEPCPVSKDLTDYNKIEKLIVKHIPKEVISQVIVDRYILEFKDDLLVLVGVNFAFDKADLLPESYTVLDKSVVLLKDKPDAKFEIEGYTDYIGTKAYNMDLSIQRAQAVKDYLVSKGIEQNRLTVVGFGKNRPVGDNKTEEGRALNRRIVFKMIK